MLDLLQPTVRDWFSSVFVNGPTKAQTLAWPPIQRGESTLLLAPTGSGKTLAAFLACIDKLMFAPVPDKEKRCRVLYVSPLKALAVDVERNLRAPLVGIANLAAFQGVTHHLPDVAVRTGDTSTKERARMARHPADIVITTPESLYLMLTSKARETLRYVETVIIDEIHALVPTKRGAHLMMSLERLEVLTGRRVQRIGLSATQRPLDEVARFLGGCEQAEPPEFRPVTIADAGATKALSLRIEVPVEDMSQIGQTEDIPSGPASQGAQRTSIWSAIHPRLIELIRANQSTLIFVNSRRLAERLSGALNELAGEVLVYAHHGSVARAQRSEIEDRLKRGEIRALVATSSLELGIDMGAIDLVVQIEAPPSVASGMQRIGRANHNVGGTSTGVVFPKYRGDLVACAAITRAMHEGRVESTRYPRVPLDILAQQIVAMVGMEPWQVEELYAVVRHAAPFVGLTRTIFDNVLELLSGRYVADDFADLRPRITWDRIAGTLTAREGARMIAVTSGGTIPDRGLYGVYLAGSGDKPSSARRVGELDEEMVFESKVGETFILGASTWRIEEITHDRVLVSPAPGQPGKMPFWRGDAAGRPLELGEKIGALIRQLRALPEAAALDQLERAHDLDRRAAENLLAYLREQAEKGHVPDDETLVIERVRDELGDWRVCVLSPLGGQIHAPWSMAIVAMIKERLGVDAESMWTNDGFVIRLPETESPPDLDLFLPASTEVEALVMRQLGGTALFAAKFRENAGRALLLLKRRPGGRTPLWQQRKRAYDLLAVASRHEQFPLLLETYRECLRDVFDMPALVSTLARIERREIRVENVEGKTPSPFASALLFGFVANYLYDGDAPLAERRAQALSIDQAQLRELLGEAELRQLLDADAIADVAAGLQQLGDRARVHSADGVHDLLLRLGDLTAAEIALRATVPTDPLLAGLQRARRIVALRIAGEERWVAVEEAARYRDALGVVLPLGLPESLLARTESPLAHLLLRYARTHGPFTPQEPAQRYALAPKVVIATLQGLVQSNRVLEGEFMPGGVQREYIDSEVLSAIRRRSLAKLRSEVEPVPPEVLQRAVLRWQGISKRRRGLDALLDVVAQLQGTPLVASTFERSIFRARLEDYQANDLDSLAAAGEVVWCGLEPLGERDGRIALFLTDDFHKLYKPPTPSELTEHELQVLQALEKNGASFFAGLSTGFAPEALDALWSLVWKGLVTNDTFRALRSYCTPPRANRKEKRGPERAFRSRRTTPPAGEGRWSRITPAALVTDTERTAAIAAQLLQRYGVLTREVAQNEPIAGGFSAVYSVFKMLEESGRIRRGYFAAGVGATQFAQPGALDLLRQLREPAEQAEVVTLAAVDPAQLYGTILPWPKRAEGDTTALGKLARANGAEVILVDGALGAYVHRGGRTVSTFLPRDEPDRARAAKAVSEALSALSHRGKSEGLLIAEIDGVAATAHALAPYLLDAGFAASSLGYYVRRHPAATAHA